MNSLNWLYTANSERMILNIKVDDEQFQEFWVCIKYNYSGKQWIPVKRYVS